MILDLMQYLQNKDHQHHKLTAAKEMEIKARLPGCAGQAADAVFAETQVKMEDAPKLLKVRTVQIFGFVHHDTNGQNHGLV